jgi:hypothetical protein
MSKVPISTAYEGDTASSSSRHRRQSNEVCGWSFRWNPVIEMRDLQAHCRSVLRGFDSLDWADAHS